MKTYSIQVIREDVPRFRKTGRIEIGANTARIVFKTKDGADFPIDETHVSQMFRTASRIYYRMNALRLVLIVLTLVFAALLSFIMSEAGTRLWLSLMVGIGGVLLLSCDAYVRVVIVVEHRKLLVLMPTKAFYDILDKRLLTAI